MGLPVYRKRIWIKTPEGSRNILAGGGTYYKAGAKRLFKRHSRIFSKAGACWYEAEHDLLGVFSERQLTNSISRDVRGDAIGHNRSGEFTMSGLPAGTYVVATVVSTIKAESAGGDASASIELTGLHSESIFSRRGEYAKESIRTFEINLYNGNKLSYKLSASASDPGDPESRASASVMISFKDKGSSTSGGATAFFETVLTTATAYNRPD